MPPINDKKSFLSVLGMKKLATEGSLVPGNEVKAIIKSKKNSKSMIKTKPNFRIPKETKSFLKTTRAE